MSNLFNYELDETRIRTTLKSTEISCCENTWQAFENLFSKEMHRQPAEVSKQPKVKLEINYKSLTPMLFFGAIVCSSVVLFKIVRFNKDSDTSVSASASGKSTNVAKASLMPAISSAKEQTAEMKDLQLTTHESAATITVSSVPAKAQTLPAVEVKATETVAAPAPVATTADVTAKPAGKPVAKRKPVVETAELQTIPSMKPTTSLSANDEKEPELDLK